MNNAAAVTKLAALAQEHRLTIFRLLVRQGPEGLPAGDIGERVGISATSASFHLKELDRAGLIAAKRDGRFIRYAFHAPAVNALLSFLTKDCCQGRPELCGGIFTAGCNEPGEVAP